MEYFQNKKDLQHCRLTENQEDLQKLILSELAKAQKNIQKSLESQENIQKSLESQENIQKSLESQISALQSLAQTKT